MATKSSGIVQSDAPGLGHLYAPAGAGPFPAILLLHGSEGAFGWLGHREAVLFAAHGYLAAPLAYSAGDNPWIAGDIWNAPLERTEAAIAALRQHPACNGEVGVYGWSRGRRSLLTRWPSTRRRTSCKAPGATYSIVTRRAAIRSNRRRCGDSRAND
jgi:dienelactone hydrolase